ncbi:MFS transporter [Marinobacterium jannaschii]|uniref:MFS transporter n=1 Tax=Marinobacterium jannaschii TaxID=64970 RepID=UPI0004802229|nr:MFS transporter [Marinobacterium jannaschii]
MNTQAQDPINSRSCIAATSIISAAGAAIFLILPILLGAAAEHLQLDEEQAGLIASSYFIGFLLVCLSAVFWIRRFDWQYVSGTGFLLLSGGLAAAAFINQYSILLALMALSGIGAGILFGLAVCVVSDTDDPDRYFGIKILAEQVVGAALLFLLPIYVTVHWGFPGMLLTVAAVLALLGLSTAWLPKRGKRGVESASSSDHTATKISVWPVWAALLALMVYFAGLSGLWAFVERIATQQGIDAVTIGKALSFGLVGGGLGAFAAALLGDRFGRLFPLVLSTGFLAAVIFIYSSAFDALLFAASTFVFSGVWNYGLAYQMGLVVSLDKRGNLSVLISSFLSLGAIVGPAIAGMLIGEQGYGGLFVFTAITIVFGLAVFALLLTKAGAPVAQKKLSKV